MSVVDDRYQVRELPAGSGLIPGYDDLLERPVDLLLLDPLPDLVGRARLLRGLRRATASTGDRVAPVIDSGSTGARPFLVFPRDRALTEVLPLSVNSAVAVVLDAIAGVQALRRAGLAPLSLQPEHLRLGPNGLRVLPAPPGVAAAQAGRSGPTGPSGSGPTNSPRAAGNGSPAPSRSTSADVHAAGVLLARLLSQGAGPVPDRLRAILAAATADTAAPIPDLARFAAELRSWLTDPRPAQSAGGRSAPPGNGGQARPTSPPPARPRPAQAQPAQSQPAQVQPAQVQPAQVQPAQVQPAQVQRGRIPAGGPAASAAEPVPQPRSAPTRPAAPVVSGAGRVTDAESFANAETIVQPRVEPAATPPPHGGATALGAEPRTEPLPPEPHLAQPAAADVSSAYHGAGPGDRAPGASSEPAGKDRAPAPLYVPLASLLHDDDEEEPEQRRGPFRYGPRDS